MDRLNVNERIASLMKRLGKCVARNPFYFLTASSLLSAVLGAGMIFAQYDVDILNMLKIRGSKYQECKILLENIFPSNTSGSFDVLRMINIPKEPIIYIMNKNGKGIHNESVFQVIQLIDDIVQNVSIKAEGKTLKYSDLCARKGHSCFSNPIMELLPEIKSLIAKRRRIKYPLEINKINYIPSYYALNLGGVIVDENGYVEDFMAARLLYFLNYRDLENNYYMEAWVDSVARELRKRKFDGIVVHVAIMSEIAEALKEVEKSLSTLIAAVLSMMIFVSMLAFITNSWIRSKPWLGVAAGISAGLAILASFGFTSYIRIPFNCSTAFVPYLILGTEIDDAFILVASWRATNPDDDTETRLGETFSVSAVSISVTSLTSFLAYCVGISTTIVFVQNMCAQSAACIFFTYIFQLTFFGSCMALDGRREEQGRNSVTFLKSKGNEERRESREEIVSKWIRKFLGGFLATSYFKFICIAAFALNLAVGIYGITFLKIGTNVNRVLLPDSEVHKSFETYYKYFTELAYPMHIVINEPLNYADKEVQQSIEETFKLFENHPHVSDSSLRISWLKYYKLFAEHPVAKFSLGGYNLSEKQDFIDGLRNVFLKLKNANQFKEDINFNDNFTEITSTRFILFLKDVPSFDVEKNVTYDLSRIVEDSSIPISIFSQIFVKAEQGVVTGSIAFQCIWMTTIIITVVFFLFVWKFLHVMSVAVCVISSIVETIGYMALWGAHLDISITGVLVLCLGFSINYPTHFSYAFLTSKLDSDEDRMKAALSVGLPIIQGSVTTISAVLILAFQKLAFYNEIFKVVFLIVFETAFHSLFFLPACLSLVSDVISMKIYKKVKEVPPAGSLEFERKDVDF